MKALFCGGGTAGHITPSIALAEEISKNDNNSVVFIGREGGGENTLITDAGYTLHTISVSGFKRSLSFSNIKTAARLLRAISDSGKLIKTLKPSVVIGTGGYVCLPALLAAIRNKIPTIIHESNTVPGLATRLLAKKCTRLLLNAEDEYGLYKLKNARIYGNPVRSAFGAQTKYQARKSLGIGNDKFFILSLGGSIGAQVINEASISLMREYSIKNAEIVHIHATGNRYYEKIAETEPVLAKGTKRCKIVPYIYDMPTYLSACDIVITRCGAMTLSEIAASAAIPILVPSPNVTADHQLKNAKRYSEAGGGILIEEGDLTYMTLISFIEHIKQDKTLQNGIKSALRNLARPEAKSNILKEIETVCIKK